MQQQPQIHSVSQSVYNGEPPVYVVPVGSPVPQYQQGIPNENQLREDHIPNQQGNTYYVLQQPTVIMNPNNGNQPLPTKKSKTAEDAETVCCLLGCCAVCLECATIFTL